MQKLATVETSISPTIASRYSAGVWLLLLLPVIAFLSVYRHLPPAARPASAPLTEFSSGRALEHVRIIAQKPHPIGSQEHASVRDYLIEQLKGLGLSPEVQKSSIISSRSGISFSGGAVENIVARLEGTSDSKAVMLAAHYDSVPTGPGASDDASGVAALLETARVLRQGPPLSNDVILLLTDGEEAGMLGASAFVKHHPWAKDVSLVMNFEARGNRGPVVMFETSDQNGWIISEFAESALHPVTNSLMYDVYKILPNDTDMTEFKKAGMSGFNFGYIYGAGHYHTLTDTADNIDSSSIQHQGAYALALTRHFGNLSLDNIKADDAVYFDVLGWSVLHYPKSWVKPLTAIVTLIFIAILVAGLRRKQLTVKGLVFGFLAFILTLALTLGMLFLMWWGIKTIHSHYEWIRGDIYNSTLYLVSFAALTIALLSLLYEVFSRKVALRDLWMGALCWWLILMIATGLLLPGASYLFMWPLLFSVVASVFAYGFIGKEPGTMSRFIALSISAIPGIVLFSPLIVLLFFGLSITAAPVVMSLLVLLLGLMIPHLLSISDSRRWLLPSLLGLVSICFLVAGSLTASLSKNQPKHNHIFYGLNADSGKAFWISGDESPDEWTKQFLSEDARRITLPEFFPRSQRSYLTAEAPAELLLPPEVALLGENNQGEIRALRLNIKSSRQAPMISVYVGAGTDIQGVVVNGKRLEYDGSILQSRQQVPLQLNYSALPPEGIELLLEVRPQTKLELKVVDQSYMLAEDANGFFKQRPESMIPAPIAFSNATLVSKSFAF